MVLILLIAAGLRLWELPHLPVGLHYDEAANLILTRQIVAGTYHPLFIRAYTGKEVLFFYTAAPWVWITGGNPWGLRLSAAMIGVLTIAATFAMGTTLFKGHHARELALLSASWMAVAFPHLLLSRYGFRAISQPLLQALTIATLWRGLRSQKRHWLIAGGVCLGLTGYTYLAARLFPIPLAIAWGGLLLRRSEMEGHSEMARRSETAHPLRMAHYSREWRSRIRQFAFVLGAAMLVFAPLGLYFLREPAAFATRITQVAATTWQDAAHGVWLCVQALVHPGGGESYVRFNLPGRPLLGSISAIFALLGLIHLVFMRYKDTLTQVARVFLWVVLCTMLLPSALATGEITPSNLRLVGLYPFIMLLPALGVSWLIRVGEKTRLRFCLQHRDLSLFLAVCMILCLGSVKTWHDYRQWAGSAALFYAADGEMVRAAQILDTTLDTTEVPTTIYIASKHYRHPTVAALARHYSEAKWLTGGATWVLPPQGDAYYVFPRTVPAPTDWPLWLTEQAGHSILPDPEGKTALNVLHLPAETIAMLRAMFSSPIADFAHVVTVHDAQPLRACHVGETCPVLVTWGVLSPYPTLQPITRLSHPRTGEWARAMVFHYPPEMWTVGDIVLDQISLDLPFGIPPGENYEVRVGFFNPDSGESLPRLVNERFAGLDVRIPLDKVLPATRSATPDEAAQVCADIRQSSVVPGERAPDTHIHLFGWTQPPATLWPGEPLFFTLCWYIQHSQLDIQHLPNSMVTISLNGPEKYFLYTGTSVEGDDFTQWPPEVYLEDRYVLRVPREAVPGQYVLGITVGNTEITQSGTIDIQPLDRHFDVPAITTPYQVNFGNSIQLLGYDVPAGNDLAATPGQPLIMTFYWRALAEMEDDYTFFIHLLDDTGEKLIAQVDEMPRASVMHGDEYPTSWWQLGEVIEGHHTITLSPDFVTETYTLRIGFYLQDTGQHLTVNGEDNLTLKVQ